MKRVYIAIAWMLMALPAIAQQNESELVVDSLAIAHFTKGVFQDNVLILDALESYGQLDDNSKKEVLECFAKVFPNCQIVVIERKNKELWMPIDGVLICVDKWKADDMEMSKYRPLDSQKKSSGGWFYYIGGMLSGSKYYSSGTLSTRVGSFLFRNSLDVGGSLNLGYTKTDESQFVGDVGIDSRWYMPYRIKNINLAPYAGAGFSWVIAPESYTELRLLAGGCWFIGPGSLDFGLRYGTKSGLSCTVGYTFRPALNKMPKR